MAKKNNTDKVSHITLKLNGKQLDSLERLLDYMEGGEYPNYVEFVKEGGTPKDHIYHHVKTTRLMMRKQIKNIG